MSELKTRIGDAVKDAMRSGDKARLGVLRLVTAAIKQREVDERVELGDDEVIAVLSKMVKQRRESIAQYQAGGRDDLAAQEQNEIDIISQFLPLPLSDAEIAAIIDQAIASTGATQIRDMGKVMGVVRPQVQGRADLGAVSALVKQRLQG